MKTRFLTVLTTLLALDMPAFAGKLPVDPVPPPPPASLPATSEPIQLTPEVQTLLFAVLRTVPDGGSLLTKATMASPGTPEAYAAIGEISLAIAQANPTAPVLTVAQASYAVAIIDRLVAELRAANVDPTGLLLMRDGILKAANNPIP